MGMSKVTPKAKYALGTPEEIANRDKTGFQPTGKPFSQLSGGGGGNLNEPNRKATNNDAPF